MREEQPQGLPHQNKLMFRTCSGVLHTQVMLPPPLTLCPPKVRSPQSCSSGVVLSPSPFTVALEGEEESLTDSHKQSQGLLSERHQYTTSPPGGYGLALDASCRHSPRSVLPLIPGPSEVRPQVSQGKTRLMGQPPPGLWQSASSVQRQRPRPRGSGQPEAQGHRAERQEQCQPSTAALHLVGSSSLSILRDIWRFGVAQRPPTAAHVDEGRRLF